MEAIQKIGDWYVIVGGAYISIFGSTKSPRLLPNFFPDKFVIMEIDYQTYVYGFGVHMLRKKRIVGQSCLLKLGLINLRVPRKHSLKQNSLEHFILERFLTKILIQGEL